MWVKCRPAAALTSTNRTALAAAAGGAAPLPRDGSRQPARGMQSAAGRNHKDTKDTKPNRNLTGLTGWGERRGSRRSTPPDGPANPVNPVNPVKTLRVLCVLVVSLILEPLPLPGGVSLLSYGAESAPDR